MIELTLAGLCIAVLYKLCKLTDQISDTTKKVCDLEETLKDHH